MKRIFLFRLFLHGVLGVGLWTLLSCSDNDTFSMDQGNRLVFSVDTVKTDTVFANVGSSTYSFWVYNQTGSGIRLSSVRLRLGNQTGFRVNVDGSYLDNTIGSVVTDLEVRKGDSIRVFVEVTPQETHQDEPKSVEDDLVFMLESGVEQRVHLLAWAWDAVMLSDLRVKRDTTVESLKPIVVYGEGIRVDSGAVLTLRNTTLYFHDQAGLRVSGALKAENVLLRGDRLDDMFDYLPYDRVSGQWKGISFTSSSKGNVLSDTEIRNACVGICLEEPAAFDSTCVRLQMTRCKVHNCKGHGVESHHSYISLDYCQLTNTLGDCLSLHGGICEMDHCTLAQFYPFSADRGAALRFSDHADEVVYPLMRLTCNYSILTGYEADVIMGERTENEDGKVLFSYLFNDCLLRTPAVEDDTLSFHRIVWETPEDSVQGKQHFKLIDEENLDYDFHLDSLSTAQGMGCYGNAPAGLNDK